MVGSRSSLLYVLLLTMPSFKLMTGSKEGAITIVLGLFGYATIISFPDKATQPSP